MRILTEKQLKVWNLIWPTGEPGPWELDLSGVQQALSKRRTAIGVYWIGYSQGTHASFQPKYCGKAVLQPLLSRLTQHVNGSHNSFIRNHVLGRTKTKVWFRFVEFATPELADLPTWSRGSRSVDQPKSGHARERRKQLHFAPAPLP